MAGNEQQMLQQDAPETVQLQQECNDLEILLDEYNRSLALKTSFLSELENENRVLKLYLNAKEKAFSELLAKYQKCKSVIEGYKQNEDILDKYMDTVKCVQERVEEKYESLKIHTYEEVNKANTTLATTHRDYENKIWKQVALMKGIQLKYKCLMDRLNDVTEQCRSMETLISEATDNV